MRRTYNEWADTVNNLPYDLVLVDMLSDWQADGIRLTKCINNLEARIAELEAEVAALNGVIDRTVNAWESRCIEKYDEIARLNATIDELIKQGNKGNIPYELWKREWDELVARIQKERERWEAKDA